MQTLGEYIEQYLRANDINMKEWCEQQPKVAYTTMRNMLYGHQLSLKTMFILARKLRVPVGVIAEMALAPEDRAVLRAEGIEVTAEDMLLVRRFGQFGEEAKKLLLAFAVGHEMLSNRQSDS